MARDHHLVITLREGESAFVHYGAIKCKVEIHDVNARSVRVGFHAPKAVKILREGLTYEVYGDE